MDKKKLFGTIIGVIAFALLIIGATYAWLTYTITPTNGVYNVGSMNFSVNYVKGTAVDNVPILDTATTETAASLNVKANKITGSAPGNLTIYLNTENTTSSTLLEAEILNYAVCIGNCTHANDLSAETYHGTVSAAGQLAILPSTPLTVSQTTYNVYFWLDGSGIDSTTVGNVYNGYISASAQQTDS